MQLKTTRLSGLDNLELKEAVFQNLSFPMHLHDTFSIGIIEKGIEKLTFGDQEILTTAKSVVLINAFESHANSCFDADKVYYKTIYISSDVVRFVLKKHGSANHAQQIYFERQPIQDNQLYNSITAFHQCSIEYKELFLNKIIEKLIVYQRVCPIDYRKQDLVENALFIEAEHFIRNNLFEKINLTQLALKLKTNKFKLIRGFKAKTGLTPIAFQIVHRIDAAKKMMRQDLPLTEIALAAGFYDQSHFIHIFKEYVGVTPGEYRAGLVFH